MISSNYIIPYSYIFRYADCRQMMYFLYQDSVAVLVISNHELSLINSMIYYLESRKLRICFQQQRKQE